jgi:hypothetical protein
LDGAGRTALTNTAGRWGGAGGTLPSLVVADTILLVLARGLAVARGLRAFWVGGGVARFALAGGSVALGVGGTADLLALGLGKGTVGRALRTGFALFGLEVALGINSGLAVDIALGLGRILPSVFRVIAGRRLRRVVARVPGTSLG